MTPEKEKEILELEARRKVFDTVKHYSGSHFREIERKSGLSVGSVKFHLDSLTRNGLIVMQKDGNNIRYFSRDIEIKNSVLLGLLRQDSVRKILIYMLTHKNFNHEDITNEVGLSPSTVSWHIKKLEENDIIIAERRGRKTFYRLLADKSEILNLLVIYKESFFDKMVDHAIEMWEM